MHEICALEGWSVRQPTCALFQSETSWGMSHYQIKPPRGSGFLEECPTASLDRIPGDVAVRQMAGSQGEVRSGARCCTTHAHPSTLWRGHHLVVLPQSYERLLLLQLLLPTEPDFQLSGAPTVGAHLNTRRNLLPRESAPWWSVRTIATGWLVIP